MSDKKLPDDVTLRTAFLEHTAERLNSSPEKMQGLENKKLLFAITGDEAGSYCMAFGADKVEVTEGDPGDSNVTITIDAGDYRKLVNGELNGMAAFMSGKLKVAGDMGLAMKLQTILG